MQRVKDLEIDQDLQFQRRAWVVQRIGWIAMVLIILAGLAGLFGNGPLSTTIKRSADGVVRIEYDRFDRFDSPTALKIFTRPEAARGDELRIHLSRDYMQGVQIQRVVPEPEHTELDNGGITYVFRLARPAQEAAVVFHFKMDIVGPLSGQLRAGNAEPLTINQFVYP